MYKCKTGEVAYNYRDYLKTNHWKNTKNRMYNSKYKYRCHCCGAKKNLQLHHKTYKRVGNERLNDLIWLCGKCHKELHNKKPKGSKLWSAARVLRKKIAKGYKF